MWPHKKGIIYNMEYWIKVRKDKLKEKEPSDFELGLISGMEFIKDIIEEFINKK